MSVKTEAVLKTVAQIIGFLSAVCLFLAILYLVLTTEPIMVFLEKWLTWIIVTAMVVPMACAAISALYSCNLSNAEARRAGIARKGGTEEK